MSPRHSAFYDDDDKEAADALRPSVVAKAERSPAAVTKQTIGRTPDGLPIHSFQTLIADLATLSENTVEIATAPGIPFTITARPTPSRKKPSTPSMARPYPVDASAHRNLPQ